MEARGNWNLAVIRHNYGATTAPVATHASCKREDVCCAHPLLLLLLYVSTSCSQIAAFPAGQSVPFSNRLQHNIRGAVSVSRDGAEFAISLGRSLVMDETHQVRDLYIAWCR